MNRIKHYLILALALAMSLGAWAQQEVQRTAYNTWKFAMPGGNRNLNIELKAQPALAWTFGGRAIPNDTTILAYFGSHLPVMAQIDNTADAEFLAAPGVTLRYGSTDPAVISFTDANDIQSISVNGVGVCDLFMVFDGNNDFFYDSAWFTVNIAEVQYSLTIGVNDEQRGSVEMLVGSVWDSTIWHGWNNENQTSNSVELTINDAWVRDYSGDQERMGSLQFYAPYDNNSRYFTLTSLAKKFNRIEFLMTHDYRAEDFYDYVNNIYKSANPHILPEDGWTFNGKYAVWQGDANSIEFSSCSTYVNQIVFTRVGDSLRVVATAPNVYSIYKNDQANVRAIADTGYHLAGWSNDFPVNASNTVRATITRDSTIIANFDTNEYVLTVAVADGQDAMGSVDGSNPAVKHFLNYQISATPNQGYIFKEWNDGNTDSVRTVTLTENTTYTASFAPDTFSLTVNTNNPQYGTVIVDIPAGAIVVNDSTFRLAYNSEVSVTATPTAGNHLSAWSNGVAVANLAGATQTITLVRDTVVRAIFEPNPYVNLSVNNSNMGSIDIVPNESINLVDQLTVASSVGSTFKIYLNGITPDGDQWINNTDNPGFVQVQAVDNSSAPFIHHVVIFNNGGDSLVLTTQQTDHSSSAKYLTIRLTSGYIYTDIFTKAPLMNGGFSSIKVYASSSSMPEGIIATATPGVYQVPTGTQITVRASRTSAAYYLSSWSNGVAVSDRTSDVQILTVNADTTLTANFAKDAPELAWHYSGDTMPAEGVTAYYGFAADTMALVRWSASEPFMATILTENPAEFHFRSTDTNVVAFDQQGTPIVNGVGDAIVSLIHDGSLFAYDSVSFTVHILAPDTLTLVSNDTLMGKVAPVMGGSDSIVVLDETAGTYGVIPGATVQVVATAKDGSHLSAWSPINKAVTNILSDTATIVVNQSQTLTATFAQNPLLTLASNEGGTVTLEGVTPGDTTYNITIEGVTYAGNNTYLVLPGTEVIVQATPDNHYHLTSWSNNYIINETLTDTLRVNNDITLSASFEKNSPELAWAYRGTHVANGTTISAYHGFEADTIAFIDRFVGDEFIDAIMDENADVHYGSSNTDVITFTNISDPATLTINGPGSATIYMVHDGKVMAYDSAYITFNILAPDTLTLAHNDGGKMTVKIGGNAVWGNRIYYLILADQYNASGITFTKNSGAITASGQLQGSFSFVSESGNFSRIEMNLRNNYIYTDWNNADGWTVDAYNAVWEGDASEVVIPRCTTNVSQIVFVRGRVNGSNSADSVRALVADTTYAVVPGSDIIVTATPDSAHYLLNFDNDDAINSNTAATKTYTVSGNTISNATFTTKPMLTLAQTEGGRIEAIVPQGGDMAVVEIPDETLNSWQGNNDALTVNHLPGFVAVDSATSTTWTGATSGISALFYKVENGFWHYASYENGVYQFDVKLPYKLDNGYNQHNNQIKIYYTSSNGIANVIATAEPNTYIIDYGTDVTVQATPDNHYHLTSWSNNYIINETLTDTLRVNNDITLSASFEKNSPELAWAYRGTHVANGTTISAYHGFEADTIALTERNGNHEFLQAITHENADLHFGSTDTNVVAFEQYAVSVVRGAGTTTIYMVHDGKVMAYDSAYITVNILAPDTLTLVNNEGGAMTVEMGGGNAVWNSETWADWTDWNVKQHTVDGITIDATDYCSDYNEGVGRLYLTAFNSADSIVFTSANGDFTRIEITFVDDQNKTVNGEGWGIEGNMAVWTGSSSKVVISNCTTLVGQINFFRNSTDSLRTIVEGSTYAAVPGATATVTATPDAVHYIVNFDNDAALNSNAAAQKTYTVGSNTTSTANFAAKPMLTLNQTEGGVTKIAGSSVSVLQLTSEMTSGWNGDNTLVTSADLPGFQPVDEDIAATWTGVSPNGWTLLLYRFSPEDSIVNYAFFYDGSYEGSFASDGRRSGVDYMRQGYNIHYTTGITLPEGILATETPNAYTVDYDSTVVVVAKPDKHYHLTSWSNNYIINETLTDTLRVNNDITLTASFEKNSPELAWTYHGIPVTNGTTITAYHGFEADTIDYIDTLVNAEFAKARYKEGASLRYGSTNPAVVSYDENGNYTVNGAGTTTIYMVHDGSLMAYDSAYITFTLLAPDTLTLVNNEGGAMTVEMNGGSSNAVWGDGTSNFKPETPYTADGITLTTSGFIFSDGQWYDGPFTFTSTEGNFTRIEITISNNDRDWGNGWTINGDIAVWEGDASEVRIADCTTYVKQITFVRGGGSGSADSIRAISENIYAAVPGATATVTATPDSVHYLVRFDNDAAINSNIAAQKTYTVNGNTTATANFNAKPTITLAQNEGGVFEAVVQAGGVTATHITSDQIPSWQGSYDPVMEADLQPFGFVAVDSAVAATWTDAPALGDAYLIYDFTGEYYKAHLFRDGQLADWANDYFYKGNFYLFANLAYFTTGTIAATGVVATAEPNKYYVDYGTDVTVVATPDATHYLVRFDSDADTNSNTAVEKTYTGIIANTTATATFAHKPTLTLSQTEGGMLTMAGANSTGVVSANATLDTFVVDYGTTVAVQATPDKHYHLTSWSNNYIINETLTDTILVNNDINLSASFEKNAPELAWVYRGAEMPTQGITAYHGFEADTIGLLSRTANEEFITASMQEAAELHFGSTDTNVVAFDQYAVPVVKGVGTTTIYMVHDGSLMAYDSVTFTVSILAPDTLTLVNNEGGKMTVEMGGGNAVWGDGTSNFKPAIPYIADGITLTKTDGTIFDVGQWMDGFTFTSESGNFSRIEMTISDNYGNDGNWGDGWTINGDNAVWEGNASVVNVNCTTNVKQISFFRGSNGGNSSDSLRAISENIYVAVPGATATATATPDSVHYLVRFDNDAALNSNIAAEKTYTVNGNTTATATFNAKPTITLAQNEGGAFEAILPQGGVTAIRPNIAMISTWEGDNDNYVTLADLQALGFVAVDSAAAASWTGAPESGLAYLFYGFTSNGENKYMGFRNGNWNGGDVFSYKRGSFYNSVSRGNFYITIGTDNITATAETNTYYVDYGTNVTVVATPDSVHYLANFDSTDVRNDNGTAMKTYTNITADFTATANFNAKPTITLAVNDTAWGTVSISGISERVVKVDSATYMFDYGTDVTVIAHATELHHVAAWTNEDSAAYTDSIFYSEYFVTEPTNLFPAYSSLTITLTGDTTVRAMFGINSYDVVATTTLDDRVSGTPLLMGTVEATYFDIEGAEQSIAADTSLTLTAQGGSTTTLVAKAEYGYLFKHWTAGNGIYFSDTLRVSEATDAKAVFVPDTFTVTLAANDSLMGSAVIAGIDASADGTYAIPYLSEMNIMAVPASRCFDFAAWSNIAETTAVSIQTVTLTGDTSITATFVRHDFPGDTTASECDLFAWHDSIYTLTPAEAPAYLYLTPDGCDSTVTLHLTVRHSNSGIETATACDQYEWQGTVYTESNTLDQRTLTNIEGCDSVVTLNLTVNYHHDTMYNDQADVRYEWLGEVFTENDTIVRTIKTYQGCDSTITLILAIAPYETPIPDIYHLMGAMLMINHFPEGFDSVGYIYYRWYRDGELVKEGLDADSYDEGGVLLDGCYYLEISTDANHKYWAKSNELCFNKGVGIADVETVSLAIAPNPVAKGSRVSVIVSGAADLMGAILTIYDAQGRQVMNTEMTNSNFEMQGSQFATGIYTVRVALRDGRIATKRLVVR